jgi:putative ABC transport system permease protein
MNLRSAFLRLRNLFRKDDGEFRDELHSHLQLHIDDNLRSGMPPDEARRQALLKLGGLEQIREQIRDQQTFPFLAALLRDFRFAARLLLRKPTFTAIAVVTLALGIGANATIFAMVSRFVLHSAPVGNPSTLLALHTTDKNECCNNFAWPLYRDVRDSAQSFSGVAGIYELLPASISGSGDPVRLWGQATSTNFFDVTQLALTLGRGFRSDENNSPVVVIGDRAWKSRFNSDPNILGKSITLSGHPYTVIGVAPPYFRGVDFILDTQFWVPIGNMDQLLPNTARFESREMHWIQVFARLKPGVTKNDAASELAFLAQGFSQAHPQTEKNLGFRFEQAGSLPPRDKSAILTFLFSLMLVSLLVLFIACANVANLFLAQAAGRQREMGVRIAVGATRTQLLRQVLTESVLLSLFGGLLGVLISVWATGGLSAFRFPVPVSIDLNVGVDTKVLVFTFLLSLATGVLFGLLPAWTAAWRFPSTALKGEDVLARPGRFWTLRNLLVVAQIAMSLVLLCVTGLCLRSLRSAANIDIGFRSSGVLAMSVDPRLHGYTPERTAQFFAELQRRVAALPGVASAAVTDSIPLNGGHRSDGFQPVGRKPVDIPSVDLFMATPGYFDTLGIHLVVGRDLSNQSAAVPAPASAATAQSSGSPDAASPAVSAAPPATPLVAIVNQDFADLFFPRENPIGQLVSGGGVNFEIIGVTNNIKSRFLGEETRPVLFRSLAQNIARDPSFEGYTVLARTAGDSSSVASSMRSIIRDMDPTLAVYNEETIEHHVRSALFLPRLAGTLFAVFGAVGLILAAIGLYGVMNYTVSLRTREIGIRMALGAQAANVQRLILRQGLQLTVIALAIGLPAALLIAKLFNAILYGIQPHDAITFTLVPLFLAAIAAIAAYLPARRASQVDPASTLRSE